MKAIWHGEVIADSNDTIVIEGNHYFPPESINKAFFKASSTHTTCPWKGEANYYNIVINAELESDAAWYYPEPKEAASQIKNHVAFYGGVEAST